MRLSIELTPEQHQRLKAVAALRGQSIKDYVLNHVLPNTATADEDEALRRLEAFLEPRIRETHSAVVNQSVQRIFEETHQEMR
ncbi:MAG: antitoxin [Methylococcales bacterium]